MADRKAVTGWPNDVHILTVEVLCVAVHKYVLGATLYGPVYRSNYKQVLKFAIYSLKWEPSSMF
jgi:hypothetical protein